MLRYQSEKELLPEGIKHFQTRSRPRNSIGGLKYIDYVRGIEHQNTYKVVEKHEKLTNQATGKVTGISFNVETLPPPLKKHRNLDIIDRKNEIENYKLLSTEFYSEEENKFGPRFSSKRSKNSHEQKNMRIEAAAFHNDTNKQLVHVGGNGFLFATISAFAYHLPLILAPDHVWMLINYAFAKHVDQNAEELRKNFVQHEGKKRLLIETGGNFSMSNNDNPDTGASAKEWERIVFANFSRQIRDHIGNNIHSTIVADFSTTTDCSRAATEITLMAAMKNYFSFGMSTMCGIPKVTLLGTAEDWINLRNRAEALSPLMKPEFSDQWMPYLLPVLDQFVESYKGNVNHSFWQTMVKLRGTSGSGAYDFISGWMQILFPILASGKINKNLRPWQGMYFQGPKPDDFPDIISSAPIDWEYFGKTFDLNLHAGEMGCSQDCKTGALMPVISWFVSHTPHQPPEVRLAKIDSELQDLLLGHKDDENVDKTQPWYQRMLVLEREKAELIRLVSVPPGF